LKLADFAITNGAPLVSNVRTFNPGGGQNLFETRNFSPDDARFLYTSSQDSFLELYSFNVAAQTSTRLTTDPSAWDEHGQYSPDGNSILWMSSHGLTPTNGTYPTEYWVMDADGSNKRQLSWFDLTGHQQFLQQTPVVAGDLDWSADGSQIVAYVQVAESLTNESDYDLLITFARTNTPVTALPTSAEMIYTAPVPGELEASNHTPVELYAMDTEGRTITRLAFDGFTYIHAAVSPDRRKVAATRAANDTNGNGALDAGDKLDLWVLDLVTGAARAVVTNYNAGLGGVDWSTDSQDIYCSMTQTSTNFDIYRIRADGSSITPVTTNLLAQIGQPGNRKWVSDVSVSRDGQWLAFIFAPAQGATGILRKTQVGICRVGGTQARLVTDGGSLPPPAMPPGVGDFDPELSPDNQFVVFRRATDAGIIGGNRSGDIYSASISNGVLTALSPTNQLVISGIPDWSLDQRVVYSALWLGLVITPAKTPALVAT
jgi:Tol biopolymer transport system component